VAALLLASMGNMLMLLPTQSPVSTRAVAAVSTVRVVRICTLGAKLFSSLWFRSDGCVGEVALVAKPMGPLLEMCGIADPLL
jgi:hypothetical protein